MGRVKIVGNRTRVIGATVVLACVVAGCSKTNNSSTASPSSTPSTKVAALGPFFGECGSVTDDEVAEALDQPKLPIVTRNSVGCVWESGSLLSPHVSFSWYRGSPIGREAQGSGGIGRPPEKITIDGHDGFAGSLEGRLCEIGVQFGDDFIHWSVSYGGFAPNGDTCDAAKKLATLTVQRAQK